MATDIVAASAAFTNSPNKRTNALRIAPAITLDAAEQAINAPDMYTLNRAVMLATLASTGTQLRRRYGAGDRRGLATAVRWVEDYRRHLAAQVAQADAALHRLHAVSDPL